jgi:hypothetical protein
MRATGGLLPIALQTRWKNAPFAAVGTTKFLGLPLNQMA